jgi:hypothetical protein
VHWSNIPFQKDVTDEANVKVPNSSDHGTDSDWLWVSCCLSKASIYRRVRKKTRVQGKVLAYSYDPLVWRLYFTAAGLTLGLIRFSSPWLMATAPRSTSPIIELRSSGAMSRIAATNSTTRCHIERTANR